MAMTNTEPTNKNFLSPLGFKFSIKKTPNVNYFVQSIEMPSMQLGEASFPTPFKRMPVAGDHIEYGSLTFTFKVDEDLANYLEIYNWIKAIGFPDNFDQHKAVDPKYVRPYTGEGIYSDASLVILSSAMNPTNEVLFRDAFPVSLSNFSFDSRMMDVDYVEATAEFKFRTFDINPL